MPNKVEITESGKNTVLVSTSPITVSINETVHTVEVAAVQRAVGNATITSGIDITNTIGDAIQGGTYGAGTTLEEIVRDLIAPFLEPAFVSTSFSAAGIHQAAGENLLVECGLAASLSAITITWSNPENLNDAANLLIKDLSATPTATIVDQAIADYGALSVPYVQSVSYAVPIVNSPITRSIKLSTNYLGNNGQGSAVPLAKTVFIHHRRRVFVFTSLSDTAPVGLETAATLYGTATSTLISTLAVDDTSASQSIAVDCNANSADTSTFTWIFIPIAGTLGEVAAEVNGKGVADYTDSWIESNNGGTGYLFAAGTANPMYRLYRSRQPGAFDSDVTLNIEIKH